MSELIREKCTACRRDSPQVTETDIAELKPQLPQWTLAEHEGVKRLQRAFRFRNFAEALRFTNRVGALAEDEGHHPAILTEWGRVTITLWTHKIRGGFTATTLSSRPRSILYRRKTQARWTEKQRWWKMPIVLVKQQIFALALRH